MRREIKIKGKELFEMDDWEILCPMSFNRSSGVDEPCVTNCAWFNEDINGKVVRCQDTYIGHIAEREE